MALRDLLGVLCGVRRVGAALSTELGAELRQKAALRPLVETLESVEWPWSGGGGGGGREGEPDWNSVGDDWTDKFDEYFSANAHHDSPMSSPSHVPPASSPLTPPHPRVEHHSPLHPLTRSLHTSLPLVEDTVLTAGQREGGVRKARQVQEVCQRAGIHWQVS